MYKYINTNFKSYLNFERDRIEEDYNKSFKSKENDYYKYDDNTQKSYFSNDKSIVLVQNGKIKDLKIYKQVSRYENKNVDYDSIMKNSKSTQKEMLKSYNDIEQVIKRCDIPENNQNYSLLVKIFNDITKYVSDCNKFIVNVYVKALIEIEKSVNTINRINSFIISKYGKDVMK